MKSKTIEVIKNYLLENAEERLQICKEIDSYDGSMEFTRTTTIEELAETMDAYELARAIIYGNVDSIESDVRFNGYANLESVTSYDLEDESESYIEEILDYIEENGIEEFTNIDLENLYDDYESEGN